MLENNPEREKPEELTEAKSKELVKKCTDLQRQVFDLEERERELTLKRSSIISDTREAEELDEEILACQRDRLVAEEEYRELAEYWEEKWVTKHPDDRRVKKWNELKRKKDI